MVSIGYFAVAMVAMVVLIWSIGLYRTHRDAAFLLIMAPLLLLWFDSALIGLGAAIGEGETLRSLSWIRYVAHALLLPFWIIAAGSIARRAGFRWAKNKWVMATFCLAATVIFAEGLIELFAMELYPACVAGSLRYVTYISEGQACRLGMEGLGLKPSGPPWAAIVPTFLFMIIGIAVWMRLRWPWLLAGSVCMLGFAAVPGSLAGPLFSNMGEPIIAAGALITLKFLLERRANEQVRPG